MQNLLLVMLGGAAGAGLRYGVGRIALVQLGPGFPWGTLFVNLSGGFAMGLLAGLLARHGVTGGTLGLLLGLGVLGGFTTFSAFSLETANMIQRGEVGLAGAYAAASLAGSVALLFAGLWIARAAA